MPIKKTPPVPPPSRAAFLWPVLETMVRIRRQRGSGVFMFSAPHRGAGTTYVVSLLAAELTREFGQRVMVADSISLKTAQLSQGTRSYIERAPNVWVPLGDGDLDRMPESEWNKVGVGLAPENFDFVLVDCPSLQEGRQGLRLGLEADGAFLVVEAGKTRTHQIENAQRCFQATSIPLEGIILNRRTYAIPKCVYNIL